MSIRPDMRESFNERTAIGPAEGLAKLKAGERQGSAPTNPKRRAVARLGIDADDAVVEQPVGISGETVIHAANERVPLCNASNEMLPQITGRTRATVVNPIPCAQCRHLIERRAEQAAQSDGGARARAGVRARPAATLETSLPGVSEPVELSMFEVGAVVAGAALAGGLIGAAIAGRR